MNLTDAQKTALKTLKINGSSTKATSPIRALVKKGLVKENRRFDSSSVYRLSEEGQRIVDSNFEG